MTSMIAAVAASSSPDTSPSPHSDHQQRRHEGIKADGHERGVLGSNPVL